MIKKGGCMKHTIALFGEAEKGVYVTPYLLQDLYELVYCLGNPPPDSRGLFYAVQALLYQHALFYLRVDQEGFSIPQYLKGLDILEREGVYSNVTAICLPGVGDQSLMDTIIPLCREHDIKFLSLMNLIFMTILLGSLYQNLNIDGADCQIRMARILGR